MPQGECHQSLGETELPTVRTSLRSIAIHIDAVFLQILHT